jgi:Fe-S-cluster containining protein
MLSSKKMLPLNIKKTIVKLTPEESSEVKQQLENFETKDEVVIEKKLINKVHLPVLNLNRKEDWKSAPLSKRKHLTDEVAAKECMSNCCGYEGLAAGCCQLDPENLEHVLGAVTKEDISRILRKLKKVMPGIERSDIVIDKEEGMLIGRTFFNGHDVFNQDTSYPMLRFQAYENRFICKFLNPKTKRCGIYEFRPDMCKNFFCQYIKKNFLIRTKDNPNTYSKIA